MRTYYVVYRVYSEKERPGAKENAFLYGWTTSNKIIKVFFKQRDRKKYKLFELREEELLKISKEGLDVDMMINILKLKSVNDQDTMYPLLMTMNEMNEVEKRIQRLFMDMTSISRIPFRSEKKEILYFTNVVLNLKDKYFDALHYIGYRPQEISSVYDSIEDDVVYQNIDLAYADKLYDQICRDIDVAYGEGIPPMEYYCEPDDVVPGLNTIDDIARAILYSLESFIKVMKDDM